MKKTTLHNAKINFLKLMKLVAQGEEIIICKAGNPIAKLVGLHFAKKKRKGGMWKGKVTIAEDFDTLPQEFMEHFE